MRLPALALTLGIAAATTTAVFVVAPTTATDALGFDPVSSASSQVAVSPSLDVVSTRVPAPPAKQPGVVSVSIPVVAVVRVREGRMVAAWTNTERPPEGAEQFHVVDGSRHHPATPGERARLVACAATSGGPWMPGRWVALNGPAC